MVDRVAVNYLRTFLERHPVRAFKKGEIVIFQGEAPRTAMVVKSGVVKAYNLSVNGDEKPVAFYASDSVFPAAWVYGKLPSATYYYEAFTPEVEIYMVDRDAFVEFVRKRPELIYLELERQLLDQFGGSLRLNALQHSRASDKLIYTLHYLALSHGKPLDKSRVEIGLNLTHQDFANLTGLTRETAATELNRLKKQKVIEYGKNVPYRLNMVRLMQLQNDQFIADMQPTVLAS